MYTLRRRKEAVDEPEFRLKRERGLDGPRCQGFGPLHESHGVWARQESPPAVPSSRLMGTLGKSLSTAPWDRFPPIKAAS